MKIWARGFESEGITLDQIRKAALKILKTRTISKMPTFAEFLEAISGSKKDKAQVQADIVLKMLRRNGSQAKPDFDDPVTVHLMSSRWQWERWARTVLEDEIKWWRKEFIEAYQSYTGRPEMINEVKRIAAPEQLRQLTETIGG